MLTNVAPAALSAALFVFSVFAPSPTPSSPPIPLTQVIPVDNFVGHVVEKSESLSAIANEYYGDEQYWTTIWNDNPLIQDPNVIEADTLLRIRADKQEKPEGLKEDLKERLAKTPSHSPLSGGEPQIAPSLI